MFNPPPPASDQDAPQQFRQVTEDTTLLIVDLLDQGHSTDDVKNRLFDQRYRADEVFPLVDRIALGRAQVAGQYISDRPAMPPRRRSRGGVRRHRPAQLAEQPEHAHYEDGPNYQQEYRDALRKVGQKNMLIGGSIFAAGLFITLITVVDHSIMGGWSILCSGPIIWGAAQIFRGASQRFGASGT